MHASRPNQVWAAAPYQQPVGSEYRRGCTPQAMPETLLSIGRLLEGLFARSSLIKAIAEKTSPTDGNPPVAG